MLCLGIFDKITEVLHKENNNKNKIKYKLVI